MVNLFPAILFAGPPHSGKSVLAYQVSQALLERGVQHYLLRAAPDGEGNWFLAGGGGRQRLLRAGHKTGYSPAFVRRIQQAIAARPLPLLVDAGGLPRAVRIDALPARPCLRRRSDV